MGVWLPGTLNAQVKACGPCAEGSEESMHHCAKIRSVHQKVNRIKGKGSLFTILWPETALRNQ